MDREIRDIYESDRDFIHQAAAEGVTLDGKKLPREIDESGRVWAICSCGRRFLVEGEGDGFISGED